MEQHFDLRALFAASAAVYLGLGVAVSLAWRELRAMPGLGRIALSYAMLVPSLVLFAFNGRAPDVITITLANTILVLVGSLVLEGIRAFYGLRPLRAVTPVVVAAACLAFGYFAHVRPSTLARTFLSSALLGVLLGMAAWASHRGRPARGERLLKLVTSAGLATCSAVFAGRALFTAYDVAWGGDLATYAGAALALLVGTFAAVVWTMTLLASANRRLTGEVEAQRELFSKLLSVARVASEGPSLDATLAETLDLARALTGATDASLLLVDEHEVYSRGIYTRADAAHVVEPQEARRLLSQGLAGWVARERKAALVRDTLADPRWHPVPAQAQMIRSALSVPIASGRTLSGVLTLVHGEPDAFREEHKRLIESAAAQIALVLRNTQIADARLQTTRQQALLIEVLRSSARSLEATAVARAAVDAIVQGGGWSHVSVVLPSEQGNYFRFLGTEVESSSVRQPVETGVVGRAWTTGQTQLVPDVSGDTDYFPHSGETRSELAVPIRPRQRTLGVLNFERPNVDGFSPEDVHLAEALAEAIGLGLENARLFRLREELTRTLVHDLRAPLISIMGSLKLLGRSARLSGDDRSLLEMAQRNAERQTDLIDAVLDLAHLEDGAMPVKPERVQLSQLAAEVLRLATPRSSERRLDLVCEVPQDLPPAWVDAGLVRRVIENLVGNAIKFSPEGAGPVTVGASLDGTRILVRVADFGPGIEPALMPTLFQPFAAGAQPARGSGLGLAFCRLAVETWGGRIWLEEPARSGAVFVLSLPAAPSEGEGRHAGAPRDGEQRA